MAAPEVSSIENFFGDLKETYLRKNLKTATKPTLVIYYYLIVGGKHEL